MTTPRMLHNFAALLLQEWELDLGFSLSRINALTHNLLAQGNIDETVEGGRASYSLWKQWPLLHDCTNLDLLLMIIGILEALSRNWEEIVEEVEVSYPWGCRGCRIKAGEGDPDHTEETRSGSSTTHANNSLPEYDSFLFEVEPDQGGLSGIVISDNSNNPLLELPEFESFHFDPSFPRPLPEPPNVEISLIVETDAPVINNFDELNEDECFDPGGGEIDVEDDDSFTFVIWTFLPFLTYPVDSPFLYSFGSEDTIFDPGIST
ncbi:hypothetical protein Tco_0921508 [Tanacetum coccineum]